MTKIKLGDAFGLDPSLIIAINWELALARIIADVRSDFVYAPHIAYIYSRAGDVLIKQMKSSLGAGTYFTGIPMTIEVPKSYRIRVAVSSKRFGPSYSRPGSILLPTDRLLYQALADQAAPIIEAQTDPKRSFSHRLSPTDSASMFLPTRTSWGALQTALAKYAKSKSVRYILKIDVAHFFGSLNQHTLINTLNDFGYPAPLSSRLEIMLTAYTGERSSRGILQGMYPSDLIGNFYLNALDRFLEDYGVVSARYVDDIYVFLDSVESADRLLREVIPFLRSYDLVLNEAKSVIMPKTALITEEPDLEELFSEAIEEVSQQVDDEDFDADYGFQSDWNGDDAEKGESEDGDGDPLVLEATKILYDSIDNFPGHEESIERFCLPLFSKAGSDYAVSGVIDALRKRPAMTQIYSSYLSNFIEQPDVRSALAGLLDDLAYADWQKMWALAALLQVKPSDLTALKSAQSLLKDANRHDALRAVAAMYIGFYGDAIMRKGLVSIYSKVSHYVQAAIYFSTRGWPNAERSNASASWGAQNPLNVLITAAFQKK